MEQTFIVKIGDRYRHVKGYVHDGVIFSSENLTAADGTELTTAHKPVLQRPASSQALDRYRKYSPVDILALKARAAAGSLSTNETKQLQAASALVDATGGAKKGIRDACIKEPDTRTPLEYRLAQGDLNMTEAEADSIRARRLTPSPGTAALRDKACIRHLIEVLSGQPYGVLAEASAMPLTEFMRRYTDSEVNGSVAALIAGGAITEEQLATFIAARAKWTGTDFTTALYSFDTAFGVLPPHKAFDAARNADEHEQFCDHRMWLDRMQQQMGQESYDPQTDLAKVAGVAGKLEDRLRRPDRDIAAAQPQLAQKPIYPRTKDAASLLTTADAIPFAQAPSAAAAADAKLTLAFQTHGELLGKLSQLWRTTQSDYDKALDVLSEAKERDFLTDAFAEGPIDLTDKGLPGYKVIKRDKKDPNLLYDGKFAACCIHLDGAGKEAATGAVTREDMAALAVIDPNGRTVSYLVAVRDKPDAKGDYKIGFVAWTGINEPVNDRREEVMDVIAERCVAHDAKIRTITIGISGHLGTSRGFSRHLADYADAVPDTLIIPGRPIVDMEHQALIYKRSRSAPSAP